MARIFFLSGEMGHQVITQKQIKYTKKQIQIHKQNYKWTNTQIHKQNTAFINVCMHLEIKSHSDHSAPSLRDHIEVLSSTLVKHRTGFPASG